jgi:hypothetical protein
MKNKIFIIIIALICLGIVVFFLYRIFQPSRPSEEGALPTGAPLPTDVYGSPIATPTSSPTVTLTPEEISKLKTIASGEILAFWPASTSTLQYFTNDGFWEVDYSKQPIQAQKKDLGISFTNILGVEYAKSNKVLIKYLASGATQPAYSVLDIQTKELKNLDLNIKSATWSPDGQNIIFYYSDSSIYYQENTTEHQYLGQIDKNLAKKKTLINFRAASDIQLSWPTSTAVFITQKPSGYVSQTALLFNPTSKIFKPFVDGSGLILNWNNSGTYGLLFTTSDGGIAPTLKLINKDALVLGSFPQLTLPEKCVFSHKTVILYCAIPSEFSSTAVWPDDYYQNAFNEEEAIYQINPESLEAQPLISDAIFEVSGIDLNQDESLLIFYDKISGKLYGLGL